MKNFNSRNSHRHHVSKRRELAQHERSRGLHQHSYNHAVRSASSAITEFGIYFFIFFILKVPEGGGANRSTGRNPPTACPLIAVT